MQEKVEYLNEMLKDVKAPFFIEIQDSVKNNAGEKCFALRPTDTSKVNTPCPVLQYGDWFELPPMLTLAYLSQIWNQNTPEIDLDLVRDPSYALMNTVPKLISKQNIPRLEKANIIYHEFLDMCIVYTIKIALEDGEMASAQITRPILNQFGWSEEELKEIAFCNASANATIVNLSSKMEDMGFPVFPMNQGAPLWIVTNKNGFNGAVSILLPEVATQIRAILGDKIAIMPSSIHECLVTIYETEDDLDELLNMVISVNETSVHPSDKLTDSVYILNADNTLSKHNG